MKQFLTFCVNNVLILIFDYYCWGITVKTHGPGMMNKDQESEMRLIKEKFTEENSLQFHQQKSASTLEMVFVGRSVYMF